MINFKDYLIEATSAKQEINSSTLYLVYYSWNLHRHQKEQQDTVVLAGKDILKYFIDNAAPLPGKNGPSCIDEFDTIRITAIPLVTGQPLGNPQLFYIADEQKTPVMTMGHLLNVLSGKSHKKYQLVAGKPKLGVWSNARTNAMHMYHGDGEDFRSNYATIIDDLPDAEIELLRKNIDKLPKAAVKDLKRLDDYNEYNERHKNDKDED